MTPSINLLVLRTKDIHTLAEFYKLLGISFDYHQHGKGAWHHSANLGGTVFEIYPLLKTQEAADSSCRLGFDVVDLDTLILQLENNKVEIVQRPKQMEWGYCAIIKDLDGRKIELKAGRE